MPDVLRAGHWAVRDVAADTAFVPSDKLGAAPGLKLRLKVSRGKGPNGSACTVTDLTGGERALTLAYILPFKAERAVWWDDPQTQRRITAGKLYINPVDTGVGVGGEASRYPLAVISSAESALCLALPLEPPRMARLLYDSGKNELRAEFDLGVSAVTQASPSSASAAVMGYEIPPDWAFRRALERYWRLHPSAFSRKVKRAGIWMPFTPLSAVHRPEDFGFGFHEVSYGNWESVKADKKLGVGSYVYVEPQTNWRVFRGEGEARGDYSGFVKQLWEDALGGDEKARATLVSGIVREDGRRDLYLGPVAYTTAAPFGCNADPDVLCESWPGWPNKGRYELNQLARPLGWSKDSGEGLSGVYVDSLEGWGEIHNFNREHWLVSKQPLSFEPQTNRVCLLNFWGTYAFVKELRERLSAKGMLLMGNDAFYRHWYLAPLVDIPGREYSWVTDGKQTPVADERYLFLRAMSGHKPYLMLMNNSFENGSHMEEYFQRSLFWAVYPGMFKAHAQIGEAAYFENPQWYERDRHLFIKYIPLISRLDEAGWQPVPLAAVSPKAIRIERYGDFTKGTLAFSLHNPAKTEQTAKLTLDARQLKLAGAPQAREWIGGQALSVRRTGGNFTLTLRLPAGGYGVVGIQR
ncbi:MAG: hypothetical protein IT209_10070 [Armatimonadetes bacterium]|nr:hypothetical protein [Armatimonadota bacterium]